MEPIWPNLLAEFVAKRRKAKGWKQMQLSHYSGVSQGTISNIEQGKSDIKKLQIETLDKLARALDVDTAILLRYALARSAPMPSLSSHDDEEELDGTDSIPRNRRYRSRDIQADALLLKMTVEENRVPRRNLNWDSERDLQAEMYILQNYISAFDLLSTSTDRIKFLIYELAPIYTNLDMFDLSDRILTQAHQLLSRDLQANQQVDPAFSGGLAQWRAINAGHLGDFETANAYLNEALPLMRVLGHTHGEATVYHFRSRFRLEGQTARFFPALPLTPANHFFLADIQSELHHAIHLEPALNFDASVAFNLLWEGQALTLSDHVHEGKTLIQRSCALFTEMKLVKAQGQALIALTRLAVLEAMSRTDLEDSKYQLEDVLGLLFQTQHPREVAEAWLLWAYCNFLLVFGYKSNTRRLHHEGANACVLVQHIYPYPTHPLHHIAEVMKTHFWKDMDEREYQNYQRQLDEQLTTRDTVMFAWLKKFLVTSKNYVHHTMSVESLLNDV